MVRKAMLFNVKLKDGSTFWTALPPQDKSEKIIQKKILPIKENLKLGINETDVQFINQELPTIRKAKILVSGKLETVYLNERDFNKRKKLKNVM